jgi:hypothetical protein
MKIITLITLITLSFQLNLRFTNQDIINNFKRFSNINLLIKGIQSTSKNFTSNIKDYDIKFKIVNEKFKLQGNKGKNHQYNFSFGSGIKKVYLDKVFSGIQKNILIPENKSGLFNSVFKNVFDMNEKVWSLVNIVYCFNGNLARSYIFLINNIGDKIDLCVVEMINLIMYEPFQMFISSMTTSTDGNEFINHNENLFVKPKNIPDVVLQNILDIYKIYIYQIFFQIYGIKIE